MKLTPESIAAIAYETNRRWQAEVGDSFASAPWDAARQEVRDSCIAGVANALMYWDTLHRLPTPEENHNFWLVYRGNKGWTLGSIVDEENRTHPDFVPWNKLSEEQQMKDVLFLHMIQFGIAVNST